MRYTFFLLALLFIGCRTEVNKAVDTHTSTVEVTDLSGNQLQTPDALLGDLFAEVQLHEVFEDGKTFVDCTAKYPYTDIKEAYSKAKDKAGFDLKEFVLEHFEVPGSISSDFKSDPK